MDPREVKELFHDIYVNLTGIRNQVTEGRVMDAG